MISHPLTLLQMQGAPLHPSRLAESSLVIIDLQEEYRSGNLPLSGVDHAVAEAARVISLARTNGVPVFHILHEVAEGAPIFDPKSPGYQPMAEVEPADGESIVVKRLPNAFAGTVLAEQLKSTGRTEIILVGAMTHMCVSATARAALDLGFRTTIVADACATRDLPGVDGTSVAAADVHRIALAELADVFAIVVPDAGAFSD
jgi:nicotinamidase-related amidase